MSISAVLKARMGKPVLLHVRPLWNRAHDEVGHCSVCGASKGLVFNSWVVPDEQFSELGSSAAAALDAYARRESLFCKVCCSSLRVRRMADELLASYGNNTVNSVSDLVNQQAFRALDVAEINTIGALGSLHTVLADLPKLIFTNYRGPSGLGQVVNGARNEDLCRLSFDDGMFDLLLTSDTLEHVPDFPAALSEIRRVLKPGGRCIFTVPIIATRNATFARATVDASGFVTHLSPALYHGRGRGLFRLLPAGEDFLTYTEFGRDLSSYVADAGFECSTNFGDDPEIGSTWVFIGKAV